MTTKTAIRERLYPASLKKMLSGEVLVLERLRDGVLRVLTPRTTKRKNVLKRLEKYS